NSNADFISLFAQSYQKINPGGQLAQLFTKPNQADITLSSTNNQVIDVIRREAKEAVKRTYNVLSERIDKFGVSQPTINLDENKSIITVELAGVKNPEQVRQYLQATAKLQFWEVATNMELAQNLINANDVLRNYLKSTNTS